MTILDDALLQHAASLAAEYLRTLPARPVGARKNAAELRPALDVPLPDGGTDPHQVLDDLARAVDPGLVASSGPRYFGFVVGGTLPVALAADWLTAAWDQNAGLHANSPAASAIEETAARWVREVFELPETAGVGFVTGCQMANFTGLAAARRGVLLRAGWDVEEHGLNGAPPVTVVVGECAHATIYRAVRMLGLGMECVRRVPADEEGRMRPDELRRTLADEAGPIIVCAQAGEVNTGAFDFFEPIAAAARECGAWLHVDGAFGLWAAASPSRRHLLRGAALADSWATDAHKWLNVPYDCGIAIVRDPALHRGALTMRAAYLVAGEEVRDPFEWTPEASRRARGFAVYAALRCLGRRGVGEMIDRCSDLARRMAERLRASGRVEILNHVVLNQVLFRPLAPPGADADEWTRQVIARVQRDGTCWLGGTTWRGRAAARISVSSWATTAPDADRSVDAILRALEP